ncbi:LysR substrate-binding domain-containing protein [Actinoallomurus sp. NBC_01490]|uniref:LysR substrate-binding domain-containing protein n=1 Tax=Actinoallomurus sp. NBC_01490 TaxID=2903557 RepID=UPI002E358CF1|nr:LysR substrate-binding domain-containing protein [Actinoallomurus sp. NBC_01490]
MSQRLPDLEALELLIAVAETGSLGQAAARQRISQPSASARMRTLERRLGVRLLVRSPSGSRLTSAGLVVTDWARTVLESAYALVEGVSALRARQHGRLRVAASLTIAENLMPGWLVTLRDVDPDVHVELNVANSAHVIERLRGGEADLGFIEGRGAPRDLHSRAVARDRLVVVASPAHPWSRKRRPLRPVELATTPLLLREAGSGTRETLEAALAPYGGVTEPALELGGTAPLRIAAVSGTAPAVLSALAVADEIAAGRLAEVPTELNLNRVLRAVWPRGRELPDAAVRLLRVTRG